ncbi:hypothetical protein ACFW04_000480 [Cataglyphis niger]
MAVGDLKTDKGVEDLNTYLADRSYIDGWQPTQADVAVLEALGKIPTSSNPHVLRWYNHIKSYDLKSLPGEKKTPSIFSIASASTAKASEDDDDLDLFGSDEEEDAEAAKIREERLKAYAEKKSKKPAVIAKSSIVLDVKSWGDETDMKEMENAVRSIEMDGLIWGACKLYSFYCSVNVQIYYMNKLLNKFYIFTAKLVPVGYGINKLQIMCVIEDEKVSVDLLIEQIQEFENLVQSVDIASFNKI